MRPVRRRNFTTEEDHDKQGKRREKKEKPRKKLKKAQLAKRKTGSRKKTAKPQGN